MHDQRGRRCLISQTRMKSRLDLHVASRGEKSVRAYLVYVLYAWMDLLTMIVVRNADQGIEKTVYGGGW